MPVVLNLIRRVDPAQQFNLFGRAISPGDLAGHIHARVNTILDAGDVENLSTIQLEDFPVLAFIKLQGQHTHTNQIGAVNTLEAFNDNGFDTEQPRTFSRPVARRAGAIK